MARHFSCPARRSH